jgi:hypothetical protein
LCLLFFWWLGDCARFLADLTSEDGAGEVARNLDLVVAVSGCGVVVPVSSPSKIQPDDVQVAGDPGPGIAVVVVVVNLTQV